jgi:hypothetical protein
MRELKRPPGRRSTVAAVVCQSAIAALAEWIAEGITGLRPDATLGVPTPAAPCAGGIA